MSPDQLNGVLQEIMDGFEEILLKVLQDEKDTEVVLRVRFWHDKCNTIHVVFEKRDKK